MTTGARLGWRGFTTSLAGAAVMITVITITSRLLGFTRWMLQARTVGYGEVGNAYASANTLPNVLFEVAAGGALAGALIPLLAVPFARNLRGEVNQVTSALLTWALALLVPLAGLVVLTAGPIAGIFIGGAASADQLDLATFFLRVFAVQIPLYGIGVVLTGVLQAQKKFFWPAFAPILSTVTVMGAYLVFAASAAGAQDAPEKLPMQAASWLAWGTTAGVAAMSLPLLIPAFRTGLRLRPTFTFPGGMARRAGRLALAGIGALLAQQVAVLVTAWLANHRGGVGVFPVFQYTQAVYLLPYAVLAVPLATSAFPRLADRVGAGDEAGFARLAAGTTRAVVLLGGFGAAVLAACAGAITWIFIGIGTGSTELMSGMSPALTVMAPGLVGFGVLFHISRALYALERARWAVLAASIGWGAVMVVSIGLAFAFVPHGWDGTKTLLALGLGNSVGMIVAGGVAVGALRRAAGPGVVSGLLRSGLTVLGAGVIASLVGRVVADGFAHWWAQWFGAPTAFTPSIGTAVLSGGAALVAVIVVFGAFVWFFDRGAVRALLPSQQRAQMPGGSQDPQSAEESGSTS